MELHHSSSTVRQLAQLIRARLLRVIEEVRTKRVTVLITRKGRPVAKLVPADESAGDVFGCLAQTLEIGEDIESPVVSSVAWKRRR
ncbi:MAG: type II toxin-antitoxin system Phd/YefM family antitoxin [Candidatus Rokubacteria bacterium]|nr:type II toxin-antitoxin system Phd/YefM family antitoxin [Candidatus Rokubacteria bacterium]